MALELGGLHLHQVSHAPDLGDESWWLLLLHVINIVLCQEDLLGVFLHGGFHLDDVLGLLHALRYLVLQLDGWELFALEVAFGDVLSKFIGSLAHILTLVFGISVQDIKGNIAKFVSCLLYTSPSPRD